MQKAKTKSGYYFKVAIILGLFVAVSVGAAKYFTVYVTNATPYYIDVHMGDYYETYVPPGNTVAMESAGRETTVIAYYSPGQGIDGHASYFFNANFPMPYTTGTDCAGRKVFYGDAGTCGRPILESYPGYDTDDEWTVTEALMSGEGSVRP